MSQLSVTMIAVVTSDNKYATLLSVNDEHEERIGILYFMFMCCCNKQDCSHIDSSYYQVKNSTESSIIHIALFVTCYSNIIKV